MKRKFLLTIIAIIMCLVTVFACVACDGNTPDDNVVPTTGELNFDENGNVIFKNTTIRLETVVNGDDTSAFDAIIARFNMIYDGRISINVTHTAQGVYETTVANKIENNNNPPDIIMSHQKSHKSFQEAGYIQSLDNIIEKSGIKIDPADYADGLAQYMKLGTDKLYSVPIDGQTHVLFYNKAELAKTGMSLPTNREELFAVCKKYMEVTGGNTPIAWCTGADYFANYVFISAILQNGATLYDSKTYMTDWYDNETNRNAFINASESIREIINLNYASYNASSSDNLNNFMKGQRLFYFTDPWSMDGLVNKYAEQKGVDKTTLFNEVLGGASFSGWFAMSDNSQKNAIFGDSHFFAMSKSVTDITKQAAVLEFIKWFTTDGTAGADWAQAGHVSVSKVINASDTYKNNSYVTNFIGNFYPDINDFTCVGVTPYYSAVINNIKSLFSETVNTKTLGGSYNKNDDAKVIKGKQDAVNNQIGFFG